MSNQYSSDAHREVIVALNGFLADTTIVYFKTHAFHWNVQGANFYSLHIMFEEFYKKLWKSTDEIAERIRALGDKTPVNYAELLKNASIMESKTIPACQIMIKVLRDDYLALAKKANDIGSFADAHEDQVTVDMMTQKSSFLEKAAWMLQSSTID